MMKIVTLAIAALLLVTSVEASEKREVVVSKFKKQAKTITPLSITEFEVTDKLGRFLDQELKTYQRDIRTYDRSH